MFQAAVENSFDFGSAEYADLFDKSAATAFQHPIWLAALYGRLLTHNLAKPLILTIRFRSDGRLAAVLPLVRRRYAGLRVIEFADLRVSDYVSPIAHAEVFAQIVANRDAVVQVRRLLKPYDLLRIGKLADQSLELELLLGIRRRESMGMNAYATPLEETFQAWREKRMQRSYCKELDKKSRQLHRRGNVRFECVGDQTEFEKTFVALKEYRGPRFENRDGGGDLLQIPAYYAFYLDIAKNGCGGFARTYVMWMEDRPIAAVLGLAHRTSFLVILGGFDFAFKNQSLGSLAFERVARDCIDRGEKFLDFTIGDEPYKLVFGAQPSPMWHISRSGSPLGYTAGLVVERLPAAKALARHLFQRSRDFRTPPARARELADTPPPDDIAAH